MGPLDSFYTHEALAGIHEQLQQGNKIAASAASEGKDDYPEPKHYPRPNEFYGYEEPPDHDEVSQADFDAMLDKDG